MNKQCAICYDTLLVGSIWEDVGLIITKNSAAPMSFPPASVPFLSLQLTIVKNVLVVYDLQSTAAASRFSFGLRRIRQHVDNSGMAPFLGKDRCSVTKIVLDGWIRAFVEQ